MSSKLDRIRRFHLPLKDLGQLIVDLVALRLLLTINFNDSTCILLYKLNSFLCRKMDYEPSLLSFLH